MRRGIAKAAGLAATFLIATGLVVAAQSTFGIGFHERTSASAATESTLESQAELASLPAAAPDASVAVAAPAATTLGMVDVSVVPKSKKATADARTKARTQKSAKPTQSAARPN
jgi:hypothetical protein